MIGKSIFAEMMKFVTLLEGKRTAEGHIRIIRKMLKPYNVKVNKFIDHTNSSFSCLTVGGFYDYDGSFGGKDIQIYLSINNRECNDVFVLDVIDAKFLIMELFKTLMHEMRHRHQYTVRSYDRYIPKRFDDEVMNYYSDSDELDAYAREASIELELTNTSFTRDKYIKLFQNSDKKILNRFMKKLYKAQTEHDTKHI